MKKFLSIIIALAAFVGIANAQISINKSNVDKPKQMTTLSMAWSWIYYFDNSYFIVMKSDNEFDDPFWLRIGKTKDECVESISSLQDLAETIGETESFDIDNGEGRTFRVTQYNALGLKGLSFRGDGFAGTTYILSSALKKALKWTQKNIE